MVLLKPAEGLEQAILAITRDRLRLLGAVRFKLSAPDPRPLASPATTQNLETEDTNPASAHSASTSSNNSSISRSCRRRNSAIVE